jgi:Spy/CpxP family protein refolding chaperone
MKRLVTLATIAGTLLLFGATPASAQPGPRQNPRRQALEQELRMRTGEVVRRRLGLTEDQMTRLQATNRKFEQQRISLFQREREARQALRRELLAGDKASQSRVDQLLNETFALERQRFDLLQSEQRELAQFLTPVQRAHLIGLQGEMRRRTQQMRRR